MPGDRRLLQRERIENSHRLLVPPLRMEGLTEHLQRAGVMVVCSEHLQAFRLRGFRPAACQILPRRLQQQFGIGGERHLQPRAGEPSNSAPGRHTLHDRWRSEGTIICTP